MSSSLRPRASSSVLRTSHSVRPSIQVQRETLLENQAKLRDAARLYTDPWVLRKAIWALRFAAIADGINSFILNPNFPLMVTPADNPDQHQDAFESTAPLDFAAANYMMPLSSYVGIAISSIVIGRLSDHYGRRPGILLCMYVGVIGSLLKYALKFNFWAYCAANLFNGLFGGSMAVALSYASDVYTKTNEKDSEMSCLVALNFIGSTGGGLIAIMMQGVGLFEPLLVSAAISLTAGLVCQVLLFEPEKNLYKKSDGDLGKDKEKEQAPTTLDHCAMYNILAGAIVDNLGSSGILPICLSPIMFNTYYADFANQGLAPILSTDGYQWIYVCLLVTVFPGSILASYGFSKAGPALTAVVTNVLTAVTAVVLLHIALAPPSTITLGIYVTIIYVSYPMSIASQLSTGPMLDRISPIDKRGLLQGFNVLIGNLIGGVGPFMYGLIYDAAGSSATLYTSAGISVLAGVINFPLVFYPAFGVPAKVESEEVGSAAETEDESAIIERAMRGEWVPSALLHEINRARVMEGQPLVHARYGTYDKAAKETAPTRDIVIEEMLTAKNTLIGAINEIQEQGPHALVEGILQSEAAKDPTVSAEIEEECGRWFKDYMINNGYNVRVSPILYKYMIQCAFPPIGQKLPTTETVEQRFLNMVRLLNRFVESEHLEETPDKECIRTFRRQSRW